MKQIMILAEGQTEETFIKNVLQPYFLDKGIYLQTTMICTKKKGNSRNYRGGMSSYIQVENDLKRLLKSTHFDLVTTFLDFYGLPEDFPGMEDLSGNCYQKIEILEEALKQDINHGKFHPFIMLHEFESMLFCDIYALKDFFYEKIEALDSLNQMAQTYSSPEEINNSRQTAPSKRILEKIPGYRKTVHGPIATKNIGITIIREQCPHFNEWLNLLENV